MDKLVNFIRLRAYTKGVIHIMKEYKSTHVEHARVYARLHDANAKETLFEVICPDSSAGLASIYVLDK